MSPRHPSRQQRRRRTSAPWAAVGPKNHAGGHFGVGLMRPNHAVTLPSWQAALCTSSTLTIRRCLAAPSPSPLAGLDPNWSSAVDCPRRNGYCEPAAPNDGGAEDSAVAQSGLGMTERENATSPPVRMIDSGRNV